MRDPETGEIIETRDSLQILRDAASQARELEIAAKRALRVDLDTASYEEKILQRAHLVSELPSVLSQSTDFREELRVHAKLKALAWSADQAIETGNAFDAASILLYPGMGDGPNSLEVLVLELEESVQDNS